MINYALVILMLLLIIFFYKKDILFFLLSFPFLYNHWLVIISVSYIENNNSFISEQGIYGSYIGSTFRLFIIEIFFFIALYLFYKLFTKNMKHNNYQFNLIQNGITTTIIKRKIKLFFYLCYFLLLVWCIHLILYGIPILLKIPRSTFLLDHQLLAKIRVLFFIFSSFLSVIIVLNNEFKISKNITKNAYLILLGFLISLLAISDKFSGPFNVVLNYVIFYYISYKIFTKQKISLIKPFTYLIVIVLILLGVVGYIYLTIEQLSYTEVKEKIIDRIFVLQGHVWYGIDNLDYYNYLNKSLSAIIGTEDQSNIGLYYLMYKIANPALVDTLKGNLISFTMGYPAILLTITDFYTSLLLTILAASITAIIYRLILTQIHKIRFIGFILTLFLYKFIQNAFNMGNIHELFLSLQTIFIYIIFIIYTFLPRKIK